MKHRCHGRCRGRPAAPTLVSGRRVLCSSAWSCFRIPVPLHAGQITGMQVCTLPLQVHPGAGTRPPPLHAGAPIAAVHDRSYAGGLPRGGLHSASGTDLARKAAQGNR